MIGPSSRPIRLIRGKNTVARDRLIEGPSSPPPGHYCKREIPGLRQMMIEARLVPAADRPALVEILMNSPEALAGDVRAWQ